MRSANSPAACHNVDDASYVCSGSNPSQYNLRCDLRKPRISNRYIRLQPDCIMRPGFYNCQHYGICILCTSFRLSQLKRQPSRTVAQLAAVSKGKHLVCILVCKPLRHIIIPKMPRYYSRFGSPITL